MNEAERIARAHRAQSANDEFVAPMIAVMREEYRDRMAEVAATELNATRRSEAIATLAVALRVVDQLEVGMREAIRDGELARSEKLRAERIEQMSDAKQRLLKIGVI